ncbi:MAG: hypothetical protein NZ889_00295 [Candidatus Pacearchaeota archaeon]|nr:hypothetical protein [Candidatus Pacearchaeota archaeon]
MPEEKLSHVIAFIIVLIVIVIVLIFAPKAFRELYSWIKGPSLSEELKEKMEDNFKKLLKSLEECSSIKDSECFCVIFPNFSDSFPKEVYLTFTVEGKTINTSLWYKKNKIREEKIKNFSLQTLSLKPTLELEQSAFLEANIEFTKKFPFEKKTKRFITSDKIYKRTHEVGFLLMTKKIQDAEKIQKMIEEFPLCKERRTEAIKEFEYIVSLLKANKEAIKKVELPIGYIIKCKKNEILLLYEGEVIKKTKIEMKKELFLKKEEVKFEKENLLCSHEAKNITSGQEIKIKNGCIE